MSPFQLTFTQRLDYSKASVILLSVELSSGAAMNVTIEAKLDTGSDFCVFQRVYADLLELELERGIRQRIRTAVGSFTAFGHEVTLTVAELEWQTTVYFAEPEDFPVNVVGRLGFLDRLRLGLVDYDQTLYLAAYDE